ncbi:hypothetical protein GCM10027168_55760 [Streptomyces capparidis]
MDVHRVAGAEGGDVVAQRSGVNGVEKVHDRLLSSLMPQVISGVVAELGAAGSGRRPAFPLWQGAGR